MNGYNFHHLNQATMIEALQLYFDSKFKEPAPKVVMVSFEADTASYVVKTDGVKKTTEEKKP